MKQLLYLLCMLTFFNAGAQQNSGKIKFQSIQPLTKAQVFLELIFNDGKITGTYSEAENPGATYDIEAAVIDKKIKGTMIDPNGLLNIKFTCQGITEGGLYFLLDDPLLNALIPDMVFTPIQFSTATDQQPPAGNSGFDKRVIGKWVHTSRYSSGDFWSTSSETMIISAAESVTIYDKVVSANTDDSYAKSSPGKLIGTAKLITRNGSLYSVHPETKQEVFIAKYTIEGNKMLTIAADGEKQLWYK